MVPDVVLEWIKRWDERQNVTACLPFRGAMIAQRNIPRRRQPLIFCEVSCLPATFRALALLSSATPPMVGIPHHCHHLMITANTVK
ncbi:MAG: hypothetical protein MR971_09440 [Bacteroidales bacterium]|nr:hypothetical protein [Bacteroidales bacterium]